MTWPKSEFVLVCVLVCSFFKVPALSAAHQDALKQAMASALRTDNGSNQQANSVKASTAPPALKKIDMSQYSKK